MVEENDLAPDFELTADDGSRVRLSALRGRKVILFFYPKANTPGCTIEACEFRDLHPAVTERGGVILGISPDKVAAQAKFRDDFGLSYRLLADTDHQVAEAYGVWKEKTLFGNSYMGVERSTFVIGEDGCIERAYRKVDPEGHANEVAESL